MTDDLKEMLIPAAISVPFFVFGFATAAGLLELTMQDVTIGILAGGICGVTALAVTLFRHRQGSAQASAA